MYINEQGWIVSDETDRQSNQTIVHHPSPHFDQRESESNIDLLVIHNISLPPGEFGTGYVHQLFEGTLDTRAHPWFVNVEGLKVSAHFLIERDGRLTQFVSCLDRAWHAGQSMFKTRHRCNDFSIGVELEGTDYVPYTDAQYDTLARLTHALRHAYPLQAVRGHCHIAPERKTDPGESFDWARYARQANWAPHRLPE